MHDFRSHFRQAFLAYCTRPVHVHLAMACIGCSFNSLFAQFKTTTKSHENYVFLYPFSSIAISPQNNEKPVFYTGKLYGLTGMWYLCAQKSPYALHPDSQKYPQHSNLSNVCLIDNGALLSCRFKKDRLALPLSMPTQRVLLTTFLQGALLVGFFFRLVLRCWVYITPGSRSVATTELGVATEVLRIITWEEFHSDEIPVQAPVSWSGRTHRAGVWCTDCIIDAVFFWTREERDRGSDQY